MQLLTLDQLRGCIWNLIPKRRNGSKEETIRDCSKNGRKGYSLGNHASGISTQWQRNGVDEQKNIHNL